MNKPIIGMTAATLILAAASMPAAADFSGYYAVGNWTIKPLGNDHGSVDTTGAPGSITLIGSDDSLVIDPQNDGYATGLEFKIAAQAAGTFRFDWNYSTADLGGPGYDPAWALVNGQKTLSDDGGATSQNGTYSVHVAAGDVIGFRIDSQDNYGGAATLVISNFSAPVTAVPEPASATMLALGLLGLGGAAALRRRSKR